MKQKLTAQIAAAYFGCKCRNSWFPKVHKEYKKIWKLAGINIDNPKYFYLSNYDGAVTSDDCLLILTPLSAISDEHAIEVAKILLPMAFVRRTKGWIVSRNYTITGFPYVKIHHNLIAYSVQIDCRLINFDVSCMEDGNNVTGETDMQPIAIIDFLRSNGYDCGYGNVKSLIDAGIAISSLQNNSE